MLQLSNSQIIQPHHLPTTELEGSDHNFEFMENMDGCISESFKEERKIAETTAFTSSGFLDSNGELDDVVLRKSSLISNQELREIIMQKEKKEMNESRHRSESVLVFSENASVSEESFDLYKHAWLTDKKSISAESFNCEDPNFFEGPDSWENCKIQLFNRHQTKEYTFECNETHNLISVVKRLGRLEKIEPNNIKIIFHDENSEKMASNGFTILEIAKANQTQIIHAIFE